MQDTTELSETIFALMHSFKVQLRSVVRTHTHDINGMHVRTLRLIKREQPCTAQHISVGLNRDKGQIARLLQELISAGWISKSPNPDDKRSQLLCLTQQGEDLIAFIAQEEKSIIETMTQGLSTDELKAFKNTANQLISNLNKNDN